MSFSKIFQFSTHATITNCKSYESQVFVKYIFAKKFWWTLQFREISKNILTFYPCQNHKIWIKWK